MQESERALQEQRCNQVDVQQQQRQQQGQQKGQHKQRKTNM